jgi:hypothetical protein
VILGYHPLPKGEVGLNPVRDIIRRRAVKDGSIATHLIARKTGLTIEEHLANNDGERELVYIPEHKMCLIIPYVEGIRTSDLRIKMDQRQGLVKIGEGLASRVLGSGFLDDFRPAILEKSIASALHHGTET